MKKLWLVLLIAVTAGDLYACEICGCGSGSGYFGIVPNYNKHYISVRYRHQAFRSYHLPEQTTVGDISKDAFNTYEIRGKYNVNAKWQLFAAVPYQSFRQTLNGVTSSYSGVGDVSVMAAYTLLNTTWSAHAMRHVVQVSDGIKLPTGAHNLIGTEGKANMNLQPGSGSFDFPIAVLYNAKWKQWGISSEVNYRVNTYNSHNEAFGNRVNAAAVFFYRKEMKTASVLPHAGIAYETAASDFDGTEKNIYSGGRSFQATAGVDAYIGKLNVSAVYQRALSSHLGGGRIEPGNGFSFTAGFNF